jgi:hypothetical protein
MDPFVVKGPADISGLAGPVSFGDGAQYPEAA